MSPDRDGFSLVEVLVALGALTLMTLIGIRGLNLFLEHWARVQIREQEVLEIRNLGIRVQGVIDQRSDHRFRTEPGILLEGTATSNGFQVRNLRVATRQDDGNPVFWELTENGGTWQERVRPAGAEPADRSFRELSYSGRILLKPRKGLSGNGRLFGQWTFPDAKSRQAQEGFAIFRFW